MSRELPIDGALIDQLVGSLQPVRPLRFSHGLGWTLAGLAATTAAVALLFGVRADVMVARFDPVFLLATGLFLLLGLASAVTVIVMSQPRVGREHGGWGWAAAMAALLPVAAVMIGLGNAPGALSAVALEHGLGCLVGGSLLAAVTFAILIWWLRRGAPTSPERAGLLTGVAAGSFAVVAISFHCDYGGIVHIGIWHSSVVVVCALLGRLAVPRLVRW